MFAWLEVLYVALMVWVVTAAGVGSQVLAILTELVGYWALAVFAVILVPGLRCIGAYLTGPVCAVYVTVAPAATESPSAAPLAPAAVNWFSVGGPLVPESPERPVVTVAGKVPVIPLKENRFE